MTYTTNSPEETEALGERLGAQLQAGDIIAFRGGLGLDDIGGSDDLARGGVCCLEWSENVPEVQDDAICIEISRGTSDMQRCITVKGGRFDETSGL